MKYSFQKLICMILITPCFCFFSCDEDRGVNIFSVEDDMELGAELDAQIQADSENYPILSRSSYPQAYAFVEQMVDDILASNAFKYGETFEWKVTIINSSTMNAFAAPGGYIYFYTGLMKYLDNSASLAGVIGHEMAHADLRHSTQVLTKVYGLSYLFSLIFGKDPGKLASLASTIATNGTALKFSRDNEYDADRYSIYYLCATKYEPTSIGNFFTKLADDGYSSDNLEFLSTHPSDENRLSHIDEVWNSDSYVEEISSGKSYDLYSSEYTNSLLNYLP
jgi:predicted Zn-dependent protease